MSVTVQLSQQDGSSSVASSSRAYESADAAVEGATDLAAAAAQAAANYYASAVAESTTTSSSSSNMLEGLTLTLPSQLQQQQSAKAFVVGPSDLLLWRWLVCLKLEGAARQAVGQVAPLAGNGELQQDFQVNSY
jgi:hypothetical protein